MSWPLPQTVRFWKRQTLSMFFIAERTGKHRSYLSASLATSQTGRPQHPGRTIRERLVSRLGHRRRLSLSDAEKTLFGRANNRQDIVRGSVALGEQRYKSAPILLSCSMSYLLDGHPTSARHVHNPLVHKRVPMESAHRVAVDADDLLKDCLLDGLVVGGRALFRVTLRDDGRVVGDNLTWLKTRIVRCETNRRQLQSA